MVSFIITLGRKRWYGARAYMLPNDPPTINWISQELEFRPKGVGKLLVRDLNACLENPRDQREEQLSTVLAGHGLTDQAQHFLLRRKYRAEGGWMWRMWREGRPILVRAYYILWAKDDFSMVGLRESRTPTDHRMVLGVLGGYGVTSHRAYAKGRTTWPIRAEQGITRQIEGDLHFMDLKMKINKPSGKDISTSAPWILDKNWKIADHSNALGSKSRNNQ